MLRISYTAPFWKLEQSVQRRDVRHDSSSGPPTENFFSDWELRGQWDNFYTAVLEAMQTMLEEGDNIQSIDIAWIPPNAPIIASLRSGLTSLTL